MKPDYFKWLLYLLVAIIVALLLTSCGASKKNVSSRKTHIDSAVVETAKTTQLHTLDSLAKRIENNTWTRETEITYPVWLDPAFKKYFPSASSVALSPQSPQSTGVIHIHIRETGTQAKQEDTHLQKKDTAAAEVNKEVTVKKEEKIIEKKKVKVGFNFWWLLLAIPLLLFSPWVRKYIVNKITP